MTREQRAIVIRETFEAITSVGFAKFITEEMLWHGNRVTEADRELYACEFRKNNFAEFERMTIGVPDARLLDVRQDWIEKANAVGLLDWRMEKERER